MPLLVGWNSEEASYAFLLQGQEPTAGDTTARCAGTLTASGPSRCSSCTRRRPTQEVIAAATDLASDMLHRLQHLEMGRSPGPDRRRGRCTATCMPTRGPPMRPEMGDAVGGLAGGVLRGEEAEAQRLPPPRGAVHSADIEYFMGNLATNMVYAWTDADEQLSELMQQYYANFVTNGDPNGRGVPQWPPANAGDSVQLMRLDIESGDRAGSPSRALPVPGRDHRRYAGALNGAAAKRQATRLPGFRSSKIIRKAAFRT